MFCRELVITFFLSVSLVKSLDWQYHNNTELEKYLKNFTSTTQGIKTGLYSIGKSTKKNDLWVVRLTAAKDSKIGVPNVKFIGTVHGNEPVGREILLHFMEFLRDNYQVDPTITWVLDNTKIHFLPNLNPDGFALASENMCEGEYGRNNAFRMDLNRNFPDYYRTNRIPEAPETKAVKKWLRDVPFILSAALHGGALVANYPFDSVQELTSLSTNPPSLTPDNDVFMHLANVYARNHLKMHKGDLCNKFQKFEGGIVNGAAWYPLTGGMQDYNYAFHGCMEITLEISCCKYPPAEALPQFWEENKMALINYCVEAHRGVTGQILDSATLQPVEQAALQISGRNITFHTGKTGEFWRLLLPGNYKLQVSANGYYDQVESFVVRNFSNFPELTFLKVYLVNSSLSTTTEKRTTKVTTELSQRTSDGAATTDSSTVAEIIEENKPMIARQIREENSANGNGAFVYFFFLLSFLPRLI
ncbi:carboxypeptidase D-like [Tribolium madens]|uniref:carboxypeptidase D-like n=1 Tax=Tribolium madens TaxID=41895 RepID=UPI001CF7297A|nr:carboxypeptidase D-like [Tribolium madens]